MLSLRRGFLYVSVGITILVSCSTEKSNEATTEPQSKQVVDNEKLRVQAFWQHYRTAQKHRAAGEWIDAKKYYIKAIEIDSTHEDAWFNLGNTHLEIGEYHDAERCWQRITVVNPNSARAHMQLGRLYLSYELEDIFDLEKAKVQFQTTSAINKVVTGPLMLLGQVALIEGDYESAEQFFEAVIGSDTKNSEAYFLLSYIAWKSKNQKKMSEFFEKAMQFSKPEAAIKGVLSEGDTKDSATFLRPINESLFKEFFTGLDKLEKEDLVGQMLERYRATDMKLVAIREMM